MKISKAHIWDSHREVNRAIKNAHDEIDAIKPKEIQWFKGGLPKNGIWHISLEAIPCFAFSKYTYQVEFINERLRLSYCAMHSKSSLSLSFSASQTVGVCILRKAHGLIGDIKVMNKLYKQVRIIVCNDPLAQLMMHANNKKDKK